MPKRKLVKDEDVEEKRTPSSRKNGLIEKASVNGNEETPAKKCKIAKVKVEVLHEPESESDLSEPKKKITKSKKKTTYTTEPTEGDIKDKVSKKVTVKRKTKEEKEAEAMPLAARTTGHRLYIGAHVSSAGGVHNAIPNTIHIGGNAFALFLKSQRKWANPPLAEDVASSFHANCKSHAYDQGSHVVPHGSYLVNLAHTDKDRTAQAYSSFIDDLKRCERLGIKLYNFHPGVANSVGGDRQAAIRHLASNLNRAHRETSTVITLLENMAHGGNTLGSTFEDLRDTIALVDDKKRVAVCLDTCHTFAGGYDLRTPAAFQATMASFEDIVGMQYLRAVHLNDSKAPFGSHRDLHANIGTGFLGLRAFHNLVNDSRFEGIPLILETPCDAKDENGVYLKDEKGKAKDDKGTWAREIKMLESLVGMDTEGEEFLELERRLAKQGASERAEMQDSIDKKAAKDAAKEERAANKGKKGGKKKKVEEESSGLSDSD